MSALKAVATLLLVVALFGCATLDPNRQLPSQPLIPAEVKTELAMKKMTDFPVKIGVVTYYDATDVVELSKKKNSFTETLPRLNEPSAETVVEAYRFLKFFRKELQNKGFRVVDEPCNSCLKVDFDFATVVLKADTPTPANLIFVRTIISYRNNRVLNARDDWTGGYRQGWLSPKASPDLAAIKAAPHAVEDMLQSWSIAIRGEKVSMK